LGGTLLELVFVAHELVVPLFRDDVERFLSEVFLPFLGFFFGLLLVFAQFWLSGLDCFVFKWFCWGCNFVGFCCVWFICWFGTTE
jgi:hypothetical protein